MALETYIDRLCGALTYVLERAATGNADRLASYAHNVDFWIDDADHCPRVVDGYEERYARLQEVQQEVVANRCRMKLDERGWSSPPPEIQPTLTSDDLKRARQHVVGTMTKFLDRCGTEGMIGQKKRHAAASWLSVCRGAWLAGECWSVLRTHHEHGTWAPASRSRSRV
jgi:hypothetical protein